MKLNVITENEYNWENEIPFLNPFMRDYFYSYDLWLKENKNNLKNDMIGIVKLQQPIIYRKVKNEKKLQMFEMIQSKLNFDVLRINFPFNNADYPINIKENASVIISSNYATWAVMYTGFIDKNIELKKYLIQNTILEYGKKLYGERMKQSIGYNKDGICIRYDLFLDNKKFCGIDYIQRKNRFNCILMIQNIYTSVEEKELFLLMENDPHWKKSKGKINGIIGVNFIWEDFCNFLQENINKIYK